jgi:aspartate/tyrosine/aromatic aminotransferase
MMMLRFEEWLTDQQERDDLIGELARVPSMQAVQHKPSRRKFDEHKNWADIVTGMAEKGHIAVFNEAWQEFLLAKQVAKDSLD